MSNFKSAAKRKRQLAKLDKRHAKDQKRAQRRAERSGVSVGVGVTASAPAVAPVAPTSTASYRPGAAPVRKPLTLAEAVDRWKSMKIAPPKKR